MSNPRSDPHPPAGAPAAGGPDPGGPGDEALDCPLCGARMLSVQCKLICENCGYREDCSDLFPVSPPR